MCVIMKFAGDIQIVAMLARPNLKSRCKGARSSASVKAVLFKGEVCGGIRANCLKAV